MKIKTMAVMVGLALGAGLADAVAANAGHVLSAPETTTWAVLIMGFGAGGTLVRRRREGMVYRLVERAAGRTLEEEFAAPDDQSALARAASVARGDFKLYRGDLLVRG